MNNRQIIRASLPIYLPSLVVQLGASMSMAFNPLWSQDLGAGVAMIGLIAAGEGIGHLIFDLPGGWMGGRMREKHFLLLSLVGLVLCGLGRALASRPWQLLLISIFMGMFISAWGIGRVAYLRRHVPSEYRGRTMAFMGGIMRLARILTPALGGVIVQFLGYRPLYLVQTGFFAVGAAALLLIMKPGDIPGNVEHPPLGVLKTTFRDNGRNIVAAMIGLTGLMLLRMSRIVIVPLWADAIGVSAVLLGSITSIGGLLETALVVPTGIIMDKAGRKWAAVPCTLGFAAALALLPLAATPLALGGIYLLMSGVNGLGSGINMTISSDLAPRHAAAEFLGIWRFVTDSGMVTGPLLIGYIAATLSLWAAPLTVAGIGFAAGAVMLLGMKETRRPPVREVIPADEAADQLPPRILR
jgi:MFS family permease